MKPLFLQTINFLPFSGTHSIDFSNIRAAVISGPNGAGKSSFFIDAIEVALYGYARSTTNDELVCDGCEAAGVTFVFAHNNKRYGIIRELTKGKTQTLKLYVFETEEGIDLSDRLLKNTQQTLLDIIGVSRDLLFCTSISPQDEINKLSTITPSQREQILSEMLNLGIWEKKKKKVSELISEGQDVVKQCEDLELNIDVLQGNSAEHQERLNDSRLKAAATQNILDDLRNQLVILQREFAAREQRLLQKQHLQEQVTVLSTEIQTLKLNVERVGAIPGPETIKDRLEVIGVDFTETRQLITGIDNHMATIRDSLVGWNSKASEVAVLRKQEQTTAILDQVPCKGMDIHSKCLLLEQANNTKKQIDAFIGGQQQALYTLEAIYINAQEQIKLWTKKQNEFQTNRDQLLQRLNNLTSQEEKLKHQISAAEELERWQKLINNKEVLLKGKQSELNSIDVTWNNAKLTEVQDACTVAASQLAKCQAEIDELTRSIANFEITIGDMQNKLAALLPQRQKTANLKTLLQAYSDIPTLLFTNTIPYVESYANEFLMRLSVDRRVYLRPYRDTKSGTQAKTLDVIGTTSTGTRNFKNLSGSEKFRESLALRIALAKVDAELYNTQIGFFIIDEGFGSLDEINVLLIKNALREAAKDFELFLVITHVPELVDTFNQRIIVRPPGKGKRVEVIEHAPTADVALDI